MREEQALKAALEAVRRAGEYANRRFGGRFTVTTKANRTPVTDVDRTCEQMLRAAIKRRFPADGVLGEEYGAVNPKAEARWILDPIDGTQSFIRGIPYWGTLLAREVRGRLTLGVIALPAIGRFFWAARGRGAWEGRRRLRVSRHGRVDGSLLVHGALDLFARRRAAGRLGALGKDGAMLRGLTDCQGYAWVAGGHAEAMLEPAAAPWDLAAPRIVVEEAGGRFTDWRGRPTHSGGNAVASNGRLHAVLLRRLRKARTRPVQ